MKKKKTVKKEIKKTYLIEDLSGGMAPKIHRIGKKSLCLRLEDIYREEFVTNGDDVKSFNENIRVYEVAKEVKYTLKDITQVTIN